MTRVGRCIVALVAAALLAPSAAHAATVTVIDSNDARIPVDLATLAPDVTDRAYAIHGKPGETSRVVTGVSLKAVLAAAGADVDQYKYAEVQDGLGRGVLLSRSQAGDGEGSGGGPPVFTVGPDGVTFLRPALRADDRNGADELKAGGMLVRLRRQKQLTIEATVSDPTPAVGARVTMTARVSGGTAGDAVDVRWYIVGESAGADGLEFRHTFRKAGTYGVGVTVTVGDENASDSLRLKVGRSAPERDPEPSRTTETTATTPPAVAAPLPGGGSGGGTPGGTGAGSAPAPAPTATTPPTTPPAEPAPEPAALKPGEIKGTLIETLPTAVTPVAETTTDVSDVSGAGDGDGGGAVLPPAAWTGIFVCLALLAGWGIERTGWRPRLPWGGQGVTA